MRKLAMAGFAALCGLCAAAGSTGPVLRLDLTAVENARVCSPHYLFSIPVHNDGDEPLVIERVRKTCNSCGHRIKLGRSTIQPGRQSEIVIHGNAKKEGPLAIRAFIHSNDVAMPAREIELKLDYVRAYAAEVSWSGAENAKTCPFDRVIEMEPVPVSNNPGLQIRLLPLAESKINQVDFSSRCFRLDTVEIEEVDCVLHLHSLTEEAGTYYDYLRVTVNERDVIAIPIQVILYGDCRLSEYSLSFSHLQAGEIVERDVRVLFDAAEDMWGEFRIEAPDEMRHAFSVAKVDRKETEAVVTIRIDGGSLGGAGMKYIPLRIVGPDDDERLFLNVYGRVY